MGTPLFVSVPQAGPSIPALIMVAAANPRNVLLVDIVLTSSVVSLGLGLGMHQEICNKGANRVIPGCWSIPSAGGVSRADEESILRHASLRGHIYEAITPPEQASLRVYRRQT